MMTPRIRPLTIRFGISAAFTFIVLLTCLALGVFFNLAMQKALRNEIRSRIHDIIVLGAGTLDGTSHASLSHPFQESGQVYRDLQTKLRTIRDSSPDIKYAYTMRKTPAGEFIFVVDATEEADDFSHIGDVYEEVTPAMIRTIEKGEPNVETEFDTDEWGTWLSGYAPIRDSSGKIDGLVGIDIAATKVVAYERRLVLAGLLITLLIGILVTAFGFFLARRITKPLMRLEEGMSKVRSLNLTADPEIPSIFKEILSMEGTIRDVKASLRSFSRYVPADLVRQLMSMGSEARLGGEKKVLSVFFSDIADFTSYAERQDPEHLVHKMAEYFEGISRIVQSHKGTVDKYIGDAVMAFWGAPLPLADHALQACRTALACAKFTIELSSRSDGALATRYGINTGEVVVGNLGYEDRLNYTIIGDAVNLGSRLESLNKAYGTMILISAATREVVKGEMILRHVDRVAVKGRQQGEDVYELLSEGKEGAPAWAVKYEKALSAYFNQQWDEAIALFQSVISDRGQDGPAKVLMERCLRFKSSPPQAGWIGVVAVREK
jgi:adenylate cyclase